MVLVIHYHSICIKAKVINYLITYHMEGELHQKDLQEMVGV